MAESNLKRRKAYQRGRDAEVFVSEQLVGSGFALLHHRYKTKYGEIDLIMRRDDLVIFVEVKARASFEVGAESITLNMQRRIADSASLWIAEQGDRLRDVSHFRFDVAIVTPGQHMTLIEGAFEAG